MKSNIIFAVAARPSLTDSWYSFKNGRQRLIAFHNPVGTAPKAFKPVSARRYSSNGSNGSVGANDQVMGNGNALLSAGGAKVTSNG